MYTVDIDTGGTFTHAFLAGDGRSERTRVDTTPHDLTIGFLNCIEEIAKVLGFAKVGEFLKQVETIRLSSTIATNTLIQKRGRKLGLIVSQGYETSAYSEKAAQNPILDYILPREMIMGVKGKVDSSGKVMEEVDEDEVREVVKELLVRGARAIVVSLLNSPLNPVQERQIKGIVETDYPKHFLGSVPLLLSTEISLSRDDASRTNAALFNAYVHREMVRFLYRAEEELFNRGYRRPLLIVHNWGGAARVAKTKAINTYASGPAAGLFGCAFISSFYDIPNVVAFDMGGTSTDIGVATVGRCTVRLETDLEGIPLKMAMVDTRSVGAGGGSIAKVEDKQLKVGPESAGALPGPVCYGLGGADPTPTDACVVLGYIDPDCFAGGRRKLDAAKANEAIRERIAQRLNLKVEEAAFQIIKQEESFCSRAVKQFLGEKKLAAKDTILLSYGGAGGIYCSGVAEATGISRVYVPPFAAAFSAFGASTMDIAHEYETLLRLPLRHSSGKYLSDFDALNQAVANLEGVAVRDIRGEGFPVEKIAFSLELELRSSTPSFLSWISSPTTRFQSQEDAKAACNELAKASPTAPTGEITLETIKLRASCPVPHPELPSYPAGGKKADGALKGRRKVFWDGGFQETPIYEQKLLKYENVVSGPAVIEGEDTTILVPKGKKYTVDKHLFGIIEEE